MHVSMDRISIAVALVLPSFAVVVTQVWGAAGGPVAAHAGSSDEEETPMVTRFEHRAIPAEGLAVMARIAEVDQIVADDPFLRKQGAGGVVDLLGEPLVETPREDIEESPMLVVTAVMAGRQPIAVVDGQPRKVGDVFGKGWTLTTIAPEGVTLQHTDGRSVMIPIHRPRP
jgi:hypothetical protein